MGAGTTARPENARYSVTGVERVFGEGNLREGAAR